MNSCIDPAPHLSAPSPSPMAYYCRHRPSAAVTSRRAADDVAVAVDHLRRHESTILSSVSPISPLLIPFVQRHRRLPPRPPLTIHRRLLSPLSRSVFSVVPFSNLTHTHTNTTQPPLLVLLSFEYVVIILIFVLCHSPQIHCLLGPTQPLSWIRAEPRPLPFIIHLFGQLQLSHFFTSTTVLLGFKICCLRQSAASSSPRISLSLLSKPVATTARPLFLGQQCTAASFSVLSLSRCIISYLSPRLYFSLAISFSRLSIFFYLPSIVTRRRAVATHYHCSPSLP